METITYIPEITFEVKVSRKGVEKFTIKGSKDAENVFRLIFNKGLIVWKEEVVMLCINRSNTVIGFYKVSSGGVTGTVIDPKIIFTIALNTPGTCSIILAHNHPSGNKQPSESDIRLTGKVKAAGDLLEINLLDHLIITDEEYLSFSDQGII